MKKSTHYFFSLGLSNLYGLLIFDDLYYSWFLIIISIATSFTSWVPNFIDLHLGTEGNNTTRFSRNRHPLTHSPWTALYFLPLFYLSGKLSILPLQVIVNLLLLSWVSHLLLDCLNPGGIPIGCKSVFTNHPVKHYQFQNDIPSKIRTIRLARIPFNSLKANRNLSYLGLSIFSLNFASSIIYSLGRLAS
jgi:hypothetical protein